MLLCNTLSLRGCSSSLALHTSVRISEQALTRAFGPLDFLLQTRSSTMVYYILMRISLRNKLRKNIPWAWRPCADLQVSTDLWVGRSTFLCMDFYALNVSLSECDLALLEWDTGSSEWDLARSHYDERLECDSAYFDQWKFRLRVVLIFNYLSYENIYPLLTLIHTFIHIHIQGVPKKTQFWRWR